MGVVVKPKNLNERQMKRVDRIAEANPERARRVSDRISARRDARGAETAVKPIMKKGGIAKAEKGGNFGMLSVKAGIDKNPNPTFADKIAGAKKKAQYGVDMMKDGGKKKMRNGGGILSAPKKDGLSMQLGTYKNIIGKNYTGKNVVNKGAKAKMGKSIMKSGGKCKNGC